jgi:DmsE family decaheme c-type cytochrome
MSVKQAILGLAVTLALGFVAGAGAAKAAEGAAPEALPAAYAAKGAATCMKCHDESPVIDVLNTPHATKGDSRTPFASHDCETCHGASPEHVASAGKLKAGDKPIPAAIRFSGPGATPIKERNAVCLGCHENAKFTNWAGSTHEANNVACDSCHTIHVKKEPLLAKATQPEKCFTCHTQQRSESFQQSHHPIREGKVTCSDCHNVHGSAGPKLVKEFTVNETCYNCHADKRGPLLWEHQPVREDCTLCHSPHGSSNARLLNERLPYLCTGCHSDDPNVVSTPGARVSSIGWFGGGASIPGHAPVGSGVINSPYMQYRSCMNCHQMVHGSNSPNGSYFIR